jgi:hypothetical protein
VYINKGPNPTNQPILGACGYKTYSLLTLQSNIESLDEIIAEAIKDSVATVSKTPYIKKIIVYQTKTFRAF